MLETVPLSLNRSRNLSGTMEKHLEQSRFVFMHSLSYFFSLKTDKGFPHTNPFVSTVASLASLVSSWFAFFPRESVQRSCKTETASVYNALEAFPAKLSNPKYGKKGFTSR